MTYRFTDDFYSGAIPISGKVSNELFETKYLIVERNGVSTAFELNYGAKCSPFDDVQIEKNVLDVGFQDMFYLFDLERNVNLAAVSMNGYFGHLYFHSEHFFAADSNGIHCLDLQGEIVWQTNNIAVDGVIIDNFENGTIYGQAEMDPPGGWEDFELDLTTGNRK